LRQLSALGPNRGAAVDVGANSGVFSYALSRLYEHVYAFEANDTITEELVWYANRKVTVFHTALSSAVGQATLHVPTKAGVALTGWGSLSEDRMPDGIDAVVHKEVQVNTLDAFELQNVTFVKIDVEGHEAEVLAGAAQTLNQWRPVILVEIKTDNIDKVTSHLRQLGYDRRRLEELTGVQGSRENYIFLPIGRSNVP
jgi:FkbM family methyltransferase